MPSTTLYLVRHAEPDHSASEVTESDSGLTSSGRSQATFTGRRLAGTRFDAVHHSPLLRAVETTTIIAGHLDGVAPHACDLARDRTPVPGTYPDRYQDFLDQVPDAERDPDATELRTAVRELGAVGERDRTDLVVTHNFVIGWFVRHVLDAPDWRWLGLNQAHAGITVVRWETGRPPVLIAFNDTGHLPS